MKCGIVGLPNVGKSTLFNCLSNSKAESANFPFCTIEPNIGTIQVPDNRLYDLAEIADPEKIIPTDVEIVDIAGLVKGASKGEGLGNKFLSNIRETQAIVHVIRCFEDDNVVHVNGEVSPLDDKEIIDMELILKDIETIDKRHEKEKKQLKSGDKSIQQTIDRLSRFKQHLEEGKTLRMLDLDEKEVELAKEMNLITSKPIMYVCNVQDYVDYNKTFVESIENMAKLEQAEVLILSLKTEEEIAEFEDINDKMEFLSEIGADEPGVNRFIRSVYALLGLQTYFTVGKKEVRAWTIKKGYLAPQAAGVIHSDFERGFIRAEVIAYDDFTRLKSESKCREEGKIRQEGKEYIVHDGDIINFKFNV